VPTMLVVAVHSGNSKLGTTRAWAARWKTTSEVVISKNVEDGAEVGDISYDRPHVLIENDAPGCRLGRRRGESIQGTSEPAC
jgi:hypothetical protein